MKQKVRPTGGDMLREVKLTDIDSIHMDSDEDTVTATFRVPVGAEGETAEYTEVIEFGRNTPDALRDAAKNFADQLLEYVKHRQANRGESPCVTCTGACCGRVYSLVHVTRKDVERMGPELAEHVVRYKNGETSWTGYTGVLKRVPWRGEGTARVEGEEVNVPVADMSKTARKSRQELFAAVSAIQGMACVFLDPETSTCTIYDRRPDVCRNYSGYGCTEHEEGSEQLVQLRRRAFGG